MSISDELVLVPVHPPYITTVIDGVTYVMMDPAVLRAALTAAAKVRANSEGDGEVKAAVQKAYDAINAGGAPYSARECRASYAISTALAILDASIPATGGEKV